jgi:hypothetical protein
MLPTSQWKKYPRDNHESWVVVYLYTESNQAFELNLLISLINSP